jgi:hypothetical protein
MHSLGVRRAVLWVLDASTTARRFYEGQGWVWDGVRVERPLGGLADFPPVIEVRYPSTSTAHRQLASVVAPQVWVCSEEVEGRFNPYRLVDERAVKSPLSTSDQGCMTAPTEVMASLNAMLPSWRRPVDSRRPQLASHSSATG